MAFTQLTDIESGYLDQGYDLPEGWDWALVHAVRARSEISEICVPLQCNVPCTVWGVPIVNGKFLKHGEG